MIARFSALEIAKHGNFIPYWADEPSAVAQRPAY
jgi:hypothetical protein